MILFCKPDWYGHHGTVEKAKINIWTTFTLMKYVSPLITYFNTVQKAYKMLMDAGITLAITSEHYALSSRKSSLSSEQILAQCLDGEETAANPFLTSTMVRRSVVIPFYFIFHQLSIKNFLNIFLLHLKGFN